MTGEWCGHGCGQTMAQAVKSCSRPPDMTGCFLKMKHRDRMYQMAAQDYLDHLCPLPLSNDRYYIEAWNTMAAQRFNVATHE